MTQPRLHPRSEAGSAIGLRLARRDLAGRTLEVLKRGNWANPDVVLVKLRCGRQVVIKDFGPRSRLVRTLYGRWVTAREAKAYRTLAGLPAVPSFLGHPDPLALALEYRPGSRMSRSLAGRLPEGFMDELRTAVREMHARGVVHLDLRHRSNVLADSDGHPVLVDFGSALCLRPGSLLSRILSPMLARIDWSAVRKWELRVAASAGLEPPASSGL